MFDLSKEKEGKEGFSILDLVTTVQSFSLEEIKNIDGIGDKIGEKNYEWFNNTKNAKHLEKLYQVGILLSINHLKISSKLSGKSFVLTGTLNSMTRSQAKDLIKQKGGKIHSSLSKNTDFLITGKSPGSKLKKAHDLGIKTINENEFKEMT